MPEWRNWWTHWTQNPASLTARVGSTPTFGTTLFSRDHLINHHHKSGFDRSNQLLLEFRIWELIFLHFRPIHLSSLVTGLKWFQFHFLLIFFLNFWLIKHL